MAYVGEDGMLGRCIRLPYHLPVPPPFYHDPILFFTMILSLYLHCELEVLKLGGEVKEEVHCRVLLLLGQYEKVGVGL